MDGRRQRREKSRDAIVQAIKRLRDGNGKHPRHVGVRIRITRQAVAREAGVSSATLYRFADILQSLSDVVGDHAEQRLRPAEQRRAALLDKIGELERQRDALLSENLRLMSALSKYDPNLGESGTVSFGDERARRRGTSKVDFGEKC